MIQKITLSLAVSSLLISHAVAENWQSLISKNELKGWQPIGGSGDNWTLKDGELKCNGKPGAQWLATEKEYSDFELSLEFNVPANGNSGVFVRAPKAGAPWVNGIEIQILDDHGDKWKNLEAAGFTGAIYAVVAPSKRVTKKAGEWQTMLIRCEGRQFQVSVNGTKVVDTSLDDHKAHFEKVPGLKSKGGHIGLQNHGDKISFRKIKVRELPAKKPQ